MRFGAVNRDVARAFVRDFHSHHAPHVSEKLAIALRSDAGEPLAVCVMGRPVACALDDGETWEVSRLCVGPEAPRFAASRLLGRATRAMDAIGITLATSYIRVDERGSCYLAAGWVPAGITRARDWSENGKGGGHATPHLPGFYEPSTERTDRVRFEWGRRAVRDESIVWDGEVGRWLRKA
jgi:hypothetical protein